MSAVQDALIRSRAVSNTARDIVLHAKASGGMGLLNFSPSDGLNQISQFQQQGANRQRYSYFRGWVHAPINALALEVASQPIHVGKVGKGGKKKPGTTKGLMPSNHGMSMLYKSTPKGLEADPDHPLLKSLEYPNMMQHQLQLMYSFVANLCLTGWAFVVAGKKEDGGFEFYSLPTTWIQPDHTQGPFSRFKVVNPNNPASGVDNYLDRKQVGFAYFPNPADPFAALSPTQAQQMGIKIDDNIQTSQSVFFDNGMFPSTLIRIGNNPHPDVTAGIAPRLTTTQRRQIIGAIKKIYSGVVNYGEPAILDGLIAGIDRLSMTSNEMGWEKSELAVRTRILSAFAVHPFILGEGVAGSYAQSYNVEKVFFRRVNTFLAMFGQTMTGLCRSLTEDEELTVWCDEIIPVDPSVENTKWSSARAREDVTENEFRAWFGLPPNDEDQSEYDKTALIAVSAIAEKVTSGAITPEQAQAILEGLGLTIKLAKKIAGDGPEEPDPNAMGVAPGAPGQFGEPGQQPPKPNAPTTTEGAVGQAAEALTKAVRLLSLSPAELADGILDDVEKNCGTGAGGFQSGNVCARGGEGGSETLGKTSFTGKPANSKGFDTESMYRHSDGAWTKERRALHEKIIKQVIGDATPVDKPRAILMGGGGGSGKSSAIKAGLVDIPKNYVHIDADAIKKHLPEYNRMLADKDVGAAGFAHEESSYLTKSILDIVGEGKYNHLLDGTGDSGIESLGKKLRKMSKGGADVEAYYVTISTQEAVTRAEKRANDPKSDSYGRQPPVVALKAAHKTVSQIVPEAVAAGLFGKFTLIDNNDKPRIIATAVGSKLKVHDQKAYNAFLEKGNE